MCFFWGGVPLLRYGPGEPTCHDHRFPAQPGLARAPLPPHHHGVEHVRGHEERARHEDAAGRHASVRELRAEKTHETEAAADLF